MVPFGKIALHVDGETVDLHDHLLYKTVMVSDVPNFAFTVGYVNHAGRSRPTWWRSGSAGCSPTWTSHGYATVTPIADDPTLTRRPFIELAAGYVNRAMHLFPQQGSHGPWRVAQDYKHDRVMLGKDPIEDPAAEVHRHRHGALTGTSGRMSTPDHDHRRGRRTRVRSRG